ncbi:hypothetical protein EPI10_006515 [Gossypium australe]|uniref:Uncharacterized protein n=1 Tax=Gossypium australe TaxID=47621 RepID=A0A5B6WRA4_9ROSI|nr:hypothetical protein EPI10_006515 [Gossypium australe]
MKSPSNIVSTWLQSVSTLIGVPLTNYLSVSIVVYNTLADEFLLLESVALDEAGLDNIGLSCFLPSTADKSSPRGIFIRASVEKMAYFTWIFTLEPFMSQL